MGFMEKMVKQCRKPTGRFGRFVGMGMNMGHGKLRRWGLNHISINLDTVPFSLKRDTCQLRSMMSPKKIGLRLLPKRNNISIGY